MRQTGLIIGYDLRKPKQSRGWRHRTDDRKQDRRELKKELVRLGAMQLQRSLWYLRGEDSPETLEAELRRLPRKGDSTVTVLTKRDRLAIFSVDAEISVRERPVDKRLRDLSNLL